MKIYKTIPFFVGAGISYFIVPWNWRFWLVLAVFFLGAYWAAEALGDKYKFKEK